MRDIALACLVAALPLWPTALDLVSSWQQSDAYHYAWLVVPMFIYLVGWHHRSLILAERPQADWIGVVVAIAAAIGWSIAAVANIDIGRQLALVVVVHGVVLAALGRALYWRLLPIMGLLFLMLPSADLLLQPLRRLTLKSIEGFALVSGLPYRSEGFSIRIGEHSYLVLDACAGLAHVTLTFFLAYCFGLLVFRSFVKTFGLALFAALLGVLSNVLRVNAIVWIDQLRGFQMDLAAHGKVQWLVLALVLSLLFRVFVGVRGDGALHRSLTVAAASEPPPGAKMTALAGGLAVLAITGLVSMRLKDDTLASVAPAPFAAPPAISDWQAVASENSWSQHGDLRLFTSGYRRGSEHLELGVVETRVAGAKLSLAPLTASDPRPWNDSGNEAVNACVASRCVDLNHVVRHGAVDSTVRHVYYAYVVGDRYTPSTLALRLATAFSRLRGGCHPARLIALSVDGAPLRGEQLAALYLAVAAASGGEYS